MTTGIYLGLVVFGGLLSWYLGWLARPANEPFDARKVQRTVIVTVIACAGQYFASPVLGPLTYATGFLAFMLGFGFGQGATAVKDVKKAGRV